MDLFTILGTCLRRWYVVLPVLAVSGYFAMQAYQQVEPLYTASTSIVILPSQTLPGVEASEDTPTLDNPYAGSGGPKLAAAVLAKNINSSSFRDRLRLAPHDTSTFQSTVAQQQPIITVDATGSSPEAVIGALDAVTNSARVVLNEFQAVAEAPEAKRYLVAAAVPASDPTDVTPSRWRTAGAILVVGSLLAALLAVAVDSMMTSRRRSHEREAAEAGPVEPEPGTPAEATSTDEYEAATPELEPIGPPDPDHDSAHETDEAEVLLHDRPHVPVSGQARSAVSVPRARTSYHRDK